MIAILSFSGERCHHEILPLIEATGPIFDGIADESQIEHFIITSALHARPQLAVAISAIHLRPFR